MIELTRVSRTWEVGSRPVHALREVTLSVAAGEYVAVMGPSGSGKSTLLSLLGGLDRPTEGSYRFEGREVASLDDDELSRLRRERIGFVFQSFNLLPRMTSLENVALPMAYAGMHKAERLERGRELLGRMGLKGKESKTPLELSGGERQRVSIARSLANRPALLLADEPTGNLDEANAAATMQALRAAVKREGAAGLLVTHSAVAAASADRVLRLAGRRLGPA